MTKILFIPVGGTICCEVNSHGTLSVGQNVSLKLVSDFLNSSSSCAGKVNITPCDDLGILSENMTVEKWNTVLGTYYQNINTDNYDGVIFAHGTDTLAYTAALLSIALCNTDIPIFIVSSNKPLDDPSANGAENFRCAVECICAGITPNIYVPYKNISNGKMHLHLASRITQCNNYSEDFNSVGMMDVSEYSGDYSGCTNIAYNYRRVLSNHINNEIHLKANKVMFIKPYVGINYDAYRYDGFSAVLHGTYHSGTACVDDNDGNYDERSVLRMIDLCALHEVDVFISPSKVDGRIYDTVRCIYQHASSGKRAMLLYGITDEMAYAKILLAYSIFDDKNKILEFITTEHNFENIYN